MVFVWLLGQRGNAEMYRIYALSHISASAGSMTTPTSGTGKAVSHASTTCSAILAVLALCLLAPHAYGIPSGPGGSIRAVAAAALARLQGPQEAHQGSLRLYASEQWEHAEVDFTEDAELPGTSRRHLLQRCNKQYGLPLS